MQKKYAMLRASFNYGVGFCHCHRKEAKRKSENPPSLRFFFSSYLIFQMHLCKCYVSPRKKKKLVKASTARAKCIFKFCFVKRVNCMSFQMVTSLALHLRWFATPLHIHSGPKSHSCARAPAAVHLSFWWSSVDEIYFAEAFDECARAKESTV